MSAAATLADCQWQDNGDAGPRETIIAFLDRIGIAVLPSDAAKDGLLSGLDVRNGGILVDPATPVWPGDLLHEAGHIAVTDPTLRPTLSKVSHDPGEEMGAIAWSWAAALHLGIDADVVFHPAGYRGGAASLAENYRAGSTMGVPILAMHGMTAEPHRAAERGIAAYPVMQRWLR